MKLYTEEQVRKAFVDGNDFVWDNTDEYNQGIDEYVQSLTSIVLLSDVEIENRIKTHNPYPRQKQKYANWANGFERGAAWIKEHIKIKSL